ncbi:MAG: Holliday junction DNA helicase RuvA [Candidatus Firestonebacteria bacterium RIFOXYA2_FULL_40_8]|nr:MAG: Holliday junction DNA helicase RuvA [Candidatus Firestonebacteria bacterium RIFOXYA2_FULL_40_8]
MIGFIKGKIDSKDKDRIIVDVNGVGYEILIPNIERISPPGEDIKVYTYFHVTDKSQALYGFLSLEEKAFFLQLISISDIGPKVALTILSGMELKRLKSAIASGDAPLLQTIPRVGKKIAGRIVIELKDKLKDEKVEDYVSSVDEGMEQDVVSALVGLGFNGTAARNAASAARLKFKDKTPDIEEVIKAALKEISK